GYAPLPSIASAATMRKRGNPTNRFHLGPSTDVTTPPQRRQSREPHPTRTRTECPRFARPATTFASTERQPLSTAVRGAERYVPNSQIGAALASAVQVRRIKRPHERFQLANR